MKHTTATYRAGVDLQPALVLELLCRFPKETVVILFMQFDVDPQLIARLIVWHKTQPVWHGFDAFWIHPVYIHVHYPSLSDSCEQKWFEGCDNLHCSSSFSRHVTFCCPAIVFESLGDKSESFVFAKSWLWERKRVDESWQFTETILISALGISVLISQPLITRRPRIGLPSPHGQQSPSPAEDFAFARFRLDD